MLLPKWGGEDKVSVVRQLHSWSSYTLYNYSMTSYLMTEWAGVIPGLLSHHVIAELGVVSKECTTCRTSNHLLLEVGTKMLSHFVVVTPLKRAVCMCVGRVCAFKNNGRVKYTHETTRTYTVGCILVHVYDDTTCLRSTCIGMSHVHAWLGAN